MNANCIHSAKPYNVILVFYHGQWMKIKFILSTGIKSIHKNNSCSNEQPTTQRPRKVRKPVYHVFIIHSWQSTNIASIRFRWILNIFCLFLFLWNGSWRQIKNLLESNFVDRTASFHEMLIKKQNEWTEKQNSATEIDFLAASTFSFIFMLEIERVWKRKSTTNLDNG